MAATVYDFPVRAQDHDASITWTAGELAYLRIAPSRFNLDPPLCSELEARMAAELTALAQTPPF